MEYMLLMDGTVTTFEELVSAPEVLDALAMHGGVGYYWHNEGIGWSAMKPDTPLRGSKRLRDCDVPDVIKLALMLE